MGFITKFKRYFDLDEEPYAEEETRTTRAVYEKPVLRKKKVVSLQSVQNAQNRQSAQSVLNQNSEKEHSKLMLRELHSYDDVQGIADELRTRRAVVISLQMISRYEAIRIIDFLSGSVYALGGDIQKLGPQTFLCTPDNMDVSGAISAFGDELEHK